MADVTQVKETIMKGLVILPGGSDRLGARLFLFPANSDYNVHPYNELVTLLAYYRRAVECKLYTFIIDMRTGCQKHLKVILRAIASAFYGKVNRVLVVKPHQLMNQSRILVDTYLDAYEFPIKLVADHKLPRYVDLCQLPTAFGGTCKYDPEQWCTLRAKYEKLLVDGSTLLRDIRRSPNVTATDATTDAYLQRAENGAKEFRTVANASEHLNGFINEDYKRWAMRIDTLCSQIKTSGRANEQRSAAESERAVYEQFCVGVENVLNWFLGPGEKWLLTLHEIGENEEAAKQLVMDHDSLEKKANDILTQVDELNKVASRLHSVESSYFLVAEKARDTLHTVSSTFMQRVARQREMCRKSVEFHRLLADCNRKQNTLNDLLLTDIHCDTAEKAETALRHLNQLSVESDAATDRVVEYGGNYVDELSVTEFTAQGHEVARDYLAAIATQKKRSLQMVDVRRLKVQQLYQLFSCEQDCDQAITWLDELRETLKNDYSHVDNKEDMMTIKRDLTKLENTARSTYDYGKQLTDVSLVLRRSLHIEVGPQITLTRRLENTWGRYCREFSETLARLSLTRAFHETAAQLGDRIDELSQRIKESTLSRSHSSLLHPEEPRMHLSPAREQSAEPESGRSDVTSDLRPELDYKRLDTDVRELRYIAEMLDSGHMRNLMRTLEKKQQHLKSLLDDTKETQNNKSSTLY